MWRWEEWTGVTYLAHLKESGIAAQVAETWQKQKLHSIFAQHGDNFTHDLLERTQAEQISTSKIWQGLS